jgi:cytochrome P450
MCTPMYTCRLFLRSTLCFAATDTTSTAICRILHLLAQHPNIQDKLRVEISAASQGGDIPYDELVALPYLDAVCRETLRV